MTQKSTDGVLYAIDPKKKTAKKISKSMKDIKEITVSDASHASMEQYHAFIREHFPEHTTRKKGFIDVKGYRLAFTAEKIICRDLMQFSKEVDLGVEFPTPTEIVEFLKTKEVRRVYSPAELREAVERGKKLLEEREKVPVEEVATKVTEEDVQKAKDKALLLLTRIEKKQADSKRMFTDIPEMVPNREIRVSLSWAFKSYNDNKIRFAKLLEKVREILTTKHEPAPGKIQPKFVGLDPVRWKDAVMVDGRFMADDKEWNYGEFLVKYILSRDKYPKAMPQIMKYLAGKITVREMIETVGKADRYVPYQESLLKGVTQQQADALTLLLWEFEEYTPLQKRYAHTDGTPFRKGMRLRVYWPDWPGVFEGKVVGLENGVQLDYDGEIADLLIHQKYEILNATVTKEEKESPKSDDKADRKDEGEKRIAKGAGQSNGASKKRGAKEKPSTAKTKKGGAKTRK